MPEIMSRVHIGLRTKPEVILWFCILQSSCRENTCFVLQICERI